MYDGVLRLPLPTGTKTVGFADDVAVVVVAKHLEEVIQRANEAVGGIRRWLAINGLQLADHKTEAVLVTSRKNRETVTLRVGGCDILSKPSLRYLGIQIDARLRFGDHIKIISTKAGAMGNALARIMPNIGGPRQERRKLIASILTSVMLYAAPIWSEAIAISSYGRQMTSVYRRSALRVARAFRTTSYDAVCVIADMVPIHLMVQERAEIHRRRCEGRADRRTVTLEAKTMMRERWQQLWDASTKGRWTHRLIPEIALWSSRQHGEVDHYLTQFLTGHGCFRVYQKRFGLDEDDTCPACSPMPESVEHIIFQCPRFEEERTIMQQHLQQQMSPESIVGEMIERETCWDAMSNFAAVVIRKLRQTERVRRDHHGIEGQGE